MGNKTRKDGAFKGERTRLAGRGEERKIGREKKKRKANPRRRRRVAPRGSFCLRSSSSFFHLSSRRYETRYYDDQRCVYIDINVAARSLLSNSVSPNG